MDVGEIIRRSGRRFGDAPAFVTGSQTLSFLDFDRATDRLGNALLADGLRPGDRVGVRLPNGTDGLVAYYALAKAGLVRVPLNVRDTTSDHAFKLTDSGCRGVIGETADDFGVATVSIALDPSDLARITVDGDDTPCAVQRDPEAPYRLGYTGGTTGRPKAVTLSMRGEHAEIANFLIDLLPEVRAGDRMLHAAPVIHASGAFVLPHLLRGATNVVLPRFDPALFCEEMERHRPSTTFLVPSMISLLLDEPGIAALDSSCLRRLCYGASPITPALVDRATAVFGPVLAQTYGQAEAPMTITFLAPNEHKRVGSAGRPYTLVEVRVVDEQDRPVPTGTAGEVVTRGQHVMTGYWGRPADTAEVLRGGWLHTGDIGVLDGDGFLTLLDRRNDVIITGGSNVYPREVEDALLSHPAVTAAAVVGIPNERWGETVHAVVSLRSAATVDELLHHAAGKVAGYKRPRSLTVWAELPTSPAGKILRREVRDAVREATSLVGKLPEGQAQTAAPRS